MKFVELRFLNSSIMLDIRYATKNNCTKQQLYPEARCFVRREVAEKLDRVQKELEKISLGLKIFDAYRPLSVQKKLWQYMPDERYVANPKKGSNHNRGAAVDLTLVDSQGKELTMPTGFDEFCELANRGFMNLPDEVIKNRQLLEDIMVKYGFIPYPNEWWHFDDQECEKYPILDISFDELMPIFYKVVGNGGFEPPTSRM